MRWRGDRTFADELPTNAQLRRNRVAGIEVLFGRESEETYSSGMQGWDGHSARHSPPQFGTVARGWICPQGQPTLVEWWEGVRPTRPRIEGSHEPTLTIMANQPRHTHNVYAELSSTVPVQHARIPTERCGAEEARGDEGHGQLRRRGGGQRIRLRGGASSGAAHDTKPAKQAGQPMGATVCTTHATSSATQAVQSVHGIKTAVWNAERLDAKGFARTKGTSRECFLKLEWLEEYIAGAEPDVVGVLEVIANFKQLRGIRKWFRPLGYEVVLLPGEGGSRREPGVHTSANAIVVAVRRSSMKIVSFCRRAERVCGVEVRVKEER